VRAELAKVLLGSSALARTNRAGLLHIHGSRSSADCDECKDFYSSPVPLPCDGLFMGDDIVQSDCSRSGGSRASTHNAADHQEILPPKCAAHWAPVFRNGCARKYRVSLPLHRFHPDVEGFDTRLHFARHLHSGWKDLQLELYLQY